MSFLKKVEKIPEEIVFLILNYIPQTEIINTLAVVSKTWSFSIISRSPLYWQGRFKRLMLILEVSEEEEMPMKKIKQNFMKKCGKILELGSFINRSLVVRRKKFKFLEFTPQMINEGKTLKLLLVGENTCQTKLVVNMTQNVDVKEDYVPTIVDGTSIDLNLFEHDFRLMIHQDFNLLTSLTYNFPYDMIVYMFDVEDRKYFEEIGINKYEILKEQEKMDTCRVLIGINVDKRANKMVKCIKRSEGILMAKKIGCNFYFEVSNDFNLNIRKENKLIKALIFSHFYHENNGNYKLSKKDKKELKKKEKKEKEKRDKGKDCEDCGNECKKQSGKKE